MNEVTGKRFRLIRTGGQRFLGFIIKVARTLIPSEKELYPAWQGMQYMHNMIDNRALLKHLDNGRYPEIQWTTVKDVLSAHIMQQW